MIRSSLRTTLTIAGTLLALAIAAPAEAARFTINIDDAGACSGTWQTTGSATNPTITCVQGTTTPPPAGSPICSITPSQTVSPGTSVTLVLTNCSPSAGLSYSWNEGSIGGTQVSGGTTYVSPLLSTTTTYFATVSVNGASTTYQTTVTVSGGTTAPPPPVAGSCSGYSAVYQGDLSFDGGRIITEGISGATVWYGRIIVPSGFAGKASSISVYEYADGQRWKKAYLSRTPCDFSAPWPAYGEGISMNLQVSFQNSTFNAVNMNGGETWYLMVKNETLAGSPACGANSSCNFALTLFAPN